MKTLRVLNWLVGLVALAITPINYDLAAELHFREREQAFEHATKEHSNAVTLLDTPSDGPIPCTTDTVPTAPTAPITSGNHNAWDTSAPVLEEVIAAVQDDDDVYAHANALLVKPTREQSRIDVLKQPATLFGLAVFPVATLCVYGVRR
jgi:hypothetical protein